MNKVTTNPEKREQTIRSCKSIVVMRGVKKTYVSSQGQLTVGPFDLEVPQGKVVSIVGASGSGKTTLLRLIAGLDTPGEGEVTVSAMQPALSRQRGAIGYMFQDPLLLPWRTVVENIRLPLEIQPIPCLEIRERTDRLVRLMKLEGFENYYPGQLSGGMQSRVAFARALITEPSILLLDEPFGRLDEITRTSLNVETSRVFSTLLTTVILVTHSIQEAVFLSDTVYVMPADKQSKLTGYSVEMEQPRVMELYESEYTHKCTARIRSLLQ